MKDKPKNQILSELLTSIQQRRGGFVLGRHFDRDNIVEIAKSQFPRLEAQVEMHHQLEATKRLLIIVAATCLLAGGALVVFAPAGREGISYVIGAAICILALGAVGIQEFRLRTIGVQIEGGARAVTATLEEARKREAEMEAGGPKRAP